MDTSYQNPLSIRARKLLTEAFFDLLKENPGKKISITALCERAGVARRTFYTHFDRIEDIPRAYLTDQWVGFLESQIPNYLGKGIPPDQFSLLMATMGYEYWAKQVETYILLKEAGMEAILVDVVDTGSEKARNLYGHKLGDISEISDPTLLKYFTSFETNTFLNLYSLWVETGRLQTVAELVEIHLTLFSDNFYSKLIERFGDNR